MKRTASKQPAGWVCCFLGVALTAPVSAQQRNANWLPPGNRISFQTGLPVNDLDLPPANTSESLSDTTGALRVYVQSIGATGGLRGPDHQLAAGLPGDPSLFNGAANLMSSLFLPKPTDPDRAFHILNYRYFISGVEHTRMGFIELDLSQEQPEVVDTGYTWFMLEPSRKRVGVPHANGEDYWLVAQPIGTGEFHAFVVASNGPMTSPVISICGSVMPVGWKYGKMIANSQGDRIVSVTEPSNYDWTDTTQAIAELFSFDPSSGALTFELALPDLRRVNGVEFSPNGRFLYVTELSTPPGQNSPSTRNLYQYDLAAADINASRLLIHAYTFVNSNLTSLNTLALGPDGRIYQAPDLNGTALGIIQNPDELGAVCDYVHDSFTCLNVIYSLPAPMKRYHDDSPDVVDALSHRNVLRGLQVAPNPAYDWIRITGKPSTAHTCVLRDGTGRVVLTEALMQGAVDLSNLACGSYVVEVFDMQGLRLGAARVMKE